MLTSSTCCALSHEPSGGQILARPYLANAVHRGHQAILAQAWVTPGSTECGMHPRGEVKNQLLGLSVHAHVPGWSCQGVGKKGVI